MKILITSGGTREAIDQVRSITNHSTGRLGKEIAEACLKAGFTVTLVTTKTAVKPAPHPHLNTIEVTNVASLQTTLEPLVKSHDIFIHSMAVSDYTPVYMTGMEEAAQAEDLYSLLEKQNTESKISSADDYQVLFLKKTPKLISLVKEWNPSICLIGFKLLVAVSQEELLSVARASLEKNQADYILANDLTEITEKEHKAYLVSKEEVRQASTKSEIAQLLVTILLEKG